MALKACIGKKGAYFWEEGTRLTYFVYTDGRDRSEEWKALYATNKKQASPEYQQYALEFAKWCYQQKSRRDSNKHADRYTAGHGSYYPGKFRVGDMYPEDSPEWKK